MKVTIEPDAASTMVDEIEFDDADEQTQAFVLALCRSVVRDQPLQFSAKEDKLEP